MFDVQTEGEAFVLAFPRCNAMRAWRVTDYWPWPKVFTDYADYRDAVCCMCEATEAYWNQAKEVRKALDGKYYSFQEFQDFYGERSGMVNWAHALHRARQEIDGAKSQALPMRKSTNNHKNRKICM